MKKITAEQKELLHATLVNERKLTLKQVSQRTGITIPVITYYKAKWGLSKKIRKGKRFYTKRTRVITGAEIKTMTSESDDNQAMAVFNQVYNKLSVFGKAVMLDNLQGWINEQKDKLNTLK